MLFDEKDSPWGINIMLLRDDIIEKRSDTIAQRIELIVQGPGIGPRGIDALQKKSVTPSK